MEQQVAALPYKNKGNVFTQAIVADCGTWLIGNFLTQYNAIQLIFHKMYRWDKKEKEVYDSLITTSFSIGCFIGCLIGASIIKRGRRKAMIWTDFFSIFGIALCLVGPNKWPVATLCAGRVIIGVLGGINNSAISIYVNEFAPKELSSTLGGFYLLFQKVGGVISLLIAIGQPTTEDMKGDKNSFFWRWIIIPAFIPVILRLIGMLFFFKSETPRFYYENGDKERAEQELNKVFCDQERIKKELALLEQKCTQIEEKIGYADVFSKKYLKCTIVGMILHAGQNLTGIKLLTFYSTDIFAPRGENSKQKDLEIACYISIVIAIFVAVPQLVLGKVVNKFGRKSILIFGQIFMIIFLSGIGFLCFYEGLIWFKLIVILCYMLSYGLSAGPIIWFYVPEFCPPKSVSLACMVNWIFVIIVGFTFPYLKIEITLGGSFLLYAGFSFFILIFQIFFCIETKGKTPKEIMEEFQGKSKTSELLHNEDNEEEKLQ